jgi:ABC-type branched-subunit amino acid transport system ATPase component/branched-subunit amino acid ABC-type transport system permease component
VEHIGSLVLGLGNGGVYAALALALVLTYRSSGVINFATGALALHGAYLYASLRDGEFLLLIPGLPESVRLADSMSFYPAASIAIAASALLGAVLYLVVFRPLRAAPPLARAIASLGVLVIIQELIALRRGTNTIVVDPIFPVERWEFGSVFVLSDRVYLALTILVLTLALSAMFRWTRFGLLTRAVADSQTGAFVTGVSADFVALVNWAISAAVAAVAGILIAPIAPLTPVYYTLFVVPALAAAIVGSFQNIVPTVAAGIAIGMLQSEAVIEATKRSWMPQTGSSELVPLIVILVALLVTGAAMPARGGLLRHPLGRAPRPRGLLLPAAAGSAVGLGALVLTSGTWRSTLIGSFIFGIIALSLVVVTGYAGQVSLAQLTLAGAGAYMLSGLTQSWGVPFPLAPLLAATFAAALGVVVGLPALRLRGLTLGVVTLGFAYAIEAVWFRNTQIVDPGGATVAQPKLFGIDLSIGSGTLAFPRVGFGIVCLVTLVLVACAVARLRTSSLGSAMLAVRANERSAAGLGVNVVRVKVLSFAIASFIAGLGGSLYAYRLGTVNFDQFVTLGNLTLLSTAYLAGVTSVWGGVLGGLIAAEGIVFHAFDQWIDFGRWFGIVAGVALIFTLIKNPEGLAAGAHAIAAKIPPLPFHGRRADADVDLSQLPVRDGTTEFSLEVENLTVRYGGVIAVDEVGLRVAARSVVGLIGPNGAGKTSVIDAVTGFAPATGRVTLAGDVVSGLPPHVLVRRGLARTFQSVELYDDLTVEENVSVSVLSAQPRMRRAAVARALEAVGIPELRDRDAGELSQGERQLVSIARACAASPRILLLDEPAAGLDTSESVWLGERIRAIALSGTGVLLVDHDVALVLRVCDYVYVLDFGRVIAEGDPATIRSNPAVVEAYLGRVHDTAAVTP